MNLDSAGAPAQLGGLLHSSVTTGWESWKLLRPTEGPSLPTMISREWPVGEGSIRACRRCGFLLLCCALHYQCEGNLLASRKFHAGGKGPVVLVIFGDSRGGATVFGLNQAERPGMPGT